MSRKRARHEGRSPSQESPQIGEPNVSYERPHLLSLPFELREMIWKYVYDDETAVHIYTAANGELANAVCPTLVSDHIAPVENAEPGGRYFQVNSHTGRGVSAVGVQPCDCLPITTWKGRDKKLAPGHCHRRERLRREAFRHRVSVPGLFFACRQTYHETVALMYTRTFFYFPTQYVLQQFGSKVPITRLRSIQSVFLHVQIDHTVTSYGDRNNLLSAAASRIEADPDDSEAWIAGQAAIRRMRNLKFCFLMISASARSETLKYWLPLDKLFQRRKHRPAMCILCWDRPDRYTFESPRFAPCIAELNVIAPGWKTRWSLGKQMRTDCPCCYRMDVYKSDSGFCRVCTGKPVGQRRTFENEHEALVSCSYAILEPLCTVSSFARLTRPRIDAQGSPEPGDSSAEEEDPEGYPSRRNRN